MNTYSCRYLKGARLKVFLAVANRIIPEDSDSPAGGTLQTAGVVDWALQRMPPDLRKRFLFFFSVINFLGFFFGGKRFFNCTPESQDRLLRWLENAPVSKIRMGFFGVKTYICMGYYTREDIWPTFKYNGPVLKDRSYADPVIRKLCTGEMEVSA